MKKVFYNITYNVDGSILDEWLGWMQGGFIKKYVDSKYFESAKMLKVLVEEELGGVTYAIMYKSPNMETLERFISELDSSLNKELTDKFGNKVLTFSTFLEEEYSV